jgi:hypothetical protein
MKNNFHVNIVLETVVAAMLDLFLHLIKHIDKA